MRDRSRHGGRGRVPKAAIVLALGSAFTAAGCGTAVHVASGGTSSSAPSASWPAAAASSAAALPAPAPAPPPLPTSTATSTAAPMDSCEDPSGSFIVQYTPAAGCALAASVVDAAYARTGVVDGVSDVAVTAKGFSCDVAPAALPGVTGGPYPVMSMQCSKGDVDIQAMAA